jgi:hypothetical protein
MLHLLWNLKIFELPLLLYIALPFDKSSPEGIAKGEGSSIQEPTPEAGERDCGFHEIFKRKEK